MMMMTGARRDTQPADADPATAPPTPAMTLPRVSLRSALTAIVWKELRTNWAYAALAWFAWIATFALTFGVFSRSDRLGGLASLLDLPPLQIIAAVIFSAIALWIGIGSTRHEREFDRWAFLVHRPLSRSWLFAGRALAALVILALGPGAGVAALFILALTPAGGDFFYTPMLLPPATPFDVAHPANVDDGSLALADGLFILDYAGRKVIPVWQTPSGEHLIRSTTEQMYDAAGHPVTWNLRITDKHLYISGASSTPVALPITLDQFTQSTTLYRPAPGHGWVLGAHGPQEFHGEAYVTPELLTFYDEEGKVLSTRTVETRFAGFPPEAGLLPTLRSPSVLQGMLTGASAPIAIAIPQIRDLFPGVWNALELGPRAQAEQFRWFTAGVLAGSLLSFAATLALAIFSRARRKLAWALAAAALGPAIPLTLLAVHHWPPRVQPSRAVPSATDVFVSNAAGAA